MSISPDAPSPFAIDSEVGLVLCVSRGTLTGKDILANVSRVHADPSWDPAYDVIWDCRRVEAHIVLPKEVGPIVDEVVEHSSGRDVLVEPDTIAGSLIAELLAVRSRLRGKDVVVKSSLHAALAELGYDRLPAPLAHLDVDAAGGA